MERRNTHREATLPPVTCVNRVVSSAASMMLIGEHGLLCAGVAVLQVCVQTAGVRLAGQGVWELSADLL